jgi:hypothetical protein
MPTFGTHQIYVTEQTLPHLSATYTKVDLSTGSFYFRREVDRTKEFQISGYIQEATMELTRTAAEAFNTDLNTQPSGVFTDGYGVQYTCLVENWEIAPIAGINKYTFTLAGRVLK